MRSPKYLQPKPSARALLSLTDSAILIQLTTQSHLLTSTNYTIPLTYLLAASVRLTVETSGAQLLPVHRDHRVNGRSVVALPQARATTWRACSALVAMLRVR